MRQYKTKPVASFRSIFRIELKQERIFGLDILRALAILFVVSGHGIVYFNEGTREFLSRFIFDGVSLFFVLSGFLIGGILVKLLEKHRRNLKKKHLLDFWIKRWFRTLPNYFLVLILLFLLDYCFTKDFSPGTIKPYLIFSQNLFSPHPDFYPEAWSLSVEEWFYLLVPVVIFSMILLLRWNARRAVMATALIFLFAITLVRYIRFCEMHPDNTLLWDQYFRKQVCTRIDSLMFGIVGAYISHYHTGWWKRYRYACLTIGLMIFFLGKFILQPRLAEDSLYFYVFSFSVNSFATLLLLPALSCYRSAKGWLFRWITRISLISYSMYLLNLSVVQLWIIDRIGWETLRLPANVTAGGRFLLYWLLVIMLSTLLYKFFEVPVTRLRESPAIKRITGRSAV